jgi:hypothetical protein
LANSVFGDLTLGSEADRSGMVNYNINPGDTASLGINGVLTVGGAGTGTFAQG